MTDGDADVQEPQLGQDPLFDGHRSIQLDKQQLKDNIDNLVAYECFMCGHITIDSVDLPFGNDNQQEEAQNNLWKKIF